MPSKNCLFDLFTDTNGVRLQSHVMNTGDGWTEHVGIWDILTNRASLDTSAGDGHNVVTGPAGCADVTVESTIITGGGAVFSAGVVANFVDINNFWIGYVEENAAYIYERNGGTLTQRGSAVIVLAKSTSASIRLVAIGDTIAFFFNNLPVITYSVSSRPHKFATRCGYYVRSVDTGSVFDGFSVRDGGWIPLGSLGTATSTAADQSSLALTTSADLLAEQVGVIIIAVDNNQTTDGDEGAVTGVVDSAGNVWLKGAEFTNGQGTAQTGTVCSLWYVKATLPLSSGGTITASFSNATSRDASAATAYRFQITGSALVSVAGSSTLAADAAASPGSLDLTTIQSEFLRIRGDASESDTSSITATSTWTKFTDAAPGGGSAASKQSVSGEFRISAGTSAASNPTNSGSRDHASVYVALGESMAYSISGRSHGALGARQMAQLHGI